MSDLKETEYGFIPSTWDLISASDYLLDVKDGTHDSPKQATTGKHLITSRHITGGKIDFSKAYLISNKDYDEINKRSKVDKWDLLLTMIGTVGEVVLVKNVPDFAIKNIGLFKCGDKLKGLWLLYFFKSILGQNAIKSRLSGTTQEYITLGDLRAFPIIVPPPEEQHSITSILSSLDNKIDLLHLQNKTLEQLAETLFHQWFIEDANEEWKEVNLEYVSERITDGSHYSPPNSEIGLPMASVKDMFQWGFNYSTCRKISVNDYNNLVHDDCRPLKNDILIAKDGSYLKHIFVVQEDMDLVILSSIAIIRPNGKYHPILLSIYLKMDSTKELLKNIVTGAVIPRIVLKEFRKFPLLLPPISEQNKILENIRPLISKCYQNVKQIHILTQLRDKLLPQLMSGEVKIKS